MEPNRPFRGIAAALFLSSLVYSIFALAYRALVR